MNKEIIEKKLHAWFSQMTEKYVWLRIKFEFNEVRGVFMVSFSPIYQIEQSDEFNLDAMNFADEMNDEYGNEAPLFTDEEALFRLSDEAEVISAHSFVSSGKPSTTLVTVQPLRVYASWASAANTTTAPAGKNFRPTQPATYAIVA